MGGYTAALNAQTGIFIPKTVTLFPSDLMNLAANPVPFLPAPGVGLMNWLWAVEMFYKFRTTAYATIAGNISLTNPANTQVWAGRATAGFVDQVQNRKNGQLLSFGATGLTGSYENQAIVIRNTGVELTLGDGLLTVTAWYSVGQA